MSPHIEGSTAEQTPSGSTNNKSPISPALGAKNYQDKEESHDSRLKAVFDERMGCVKRAAVSYRKAVVLLLSWHRDIDDLHTEDEVAKLRLVFEKRFGYETVTEVLTKHPYKTAQSQANLLLAKFVHDYDAHDTLLIVYYAGHGRPGRARGIVVLEPSKSLDDVEGSELHEVVWNSAEAIINSTQGDVLVIFDCCHAGELDQNVRSNVGVRAFEFMAATSANSTTRQPGKNSFTTALIWALKELADTGERFLTQEVITAIMRAPNFPKDQSPRLIDRGRACIRKIALTPLNASNESVSSNAQEEIPEGGFREDLSIRFVFSKSVSEKMVRDLASGLRRLISDGDFKTTAVLWEGINASPPIRIKFREVVGRVMSRHKLHKRNQSAATISSAEDSHPESFPSAPESDGAVTPIAPTASAEPEIGEDQGAPSKVLSVDTGLSFHTPMSSPVANSPRKRRRDRLTDAIDETDLQQTAKKTKVQN
ncbi:hypothetical protein G7Y89_g1792 [Cudoniella acicularis]|uniref:Peptidase C14 caspase domain-containing protein n=1 Tax=Cudoniella acicularis TaxID=354080 RepID=A0A8H4W977_9HELO|nr:hypothetical protein G7Y89_g1792 [Cudoniella acicularis]